MDNAIKYRVWNIGLPRTGTTTFCEALKILGYTKIKHNPRYEHLNDLQAASDAGCILYYKYLDYKYPNSKFVLAQRDLESWLASAEFIYEKYPATDKDIAILRRMHLYESVTFNRDKFVEAYHRHHESVRRYFKHRPVDLLEMNIVDGEGWGNLCPFLELPIPAEPFPHANKRINAYTVPQNVQSQNIQNQSSQTRNEVF